MTGSMPGIAASTSETWVFGSPPNSVAAPENSFDFEVTWAWTSSPITISQSPVAPLINFVAGAAPGFYSLAVWGGGPPPPGLGGRARTASPPARAHRRDSRGYPLHSADK